MANGQPSDIARELRLIRNALLGLFGVAAVWAGLRFSEALIRPPAPNWQELRDIQGELRQLREELARHRPAQPAPVVIPVRPPAGAGAAKDK
jgi:hypothetical protein